MECLFLIKYGEISLKGKNRPKFEQRLLTNIRQRFPGHKLHIIHTKGRIYLYCDEAAAGEVGDGLAEIFGIVSYSRARVQEKKMEAVLESALELAREAGAGRTALRFKAEARRTDKSFPFSSYDIVCKVGDHISANCPGFTVDVRNPAWVLSIEIREKAYLYGGLSEGLCGLPVGCNGRGLLLLSGGIDSPVAGFMMAKRGLTVDALYFHTHPFTSPEARDKVIDLASRLAHFIPNLRLWIIPFTETQLRIKEKAAANAVTLMSRASMMRIAELIAQKENIPVLITGESLGQVASQTPESLSFTGRFVRLPVLRPLIGMDKLEIIERAITIDTYGISTRPFDDCCTIFAPEHPLINPNVEALEADYNALELDDLLTAAAAAREVIAVH